MRSLSSSLPLSKFGSIRDCLDACLVLPTAENAQGQTMLIRKVAMLTKPGQQNQDLRENPRRYDRLDYDNDNGAESSR